MQRNWLLTLVLGLAFVNQPVSAAEPAAQNGPAYDVYDENWTAEDNATWQKVRDTLKQIDVSNQSPDQKCHARWNAIWPVAKAGNPEARYALSQMLVLGEYSPYAFSFRISGSVKNQDDVARNSIMGIFYGYDGPTLRKLSKLDWVVSISLLLSNFEQIKAYNACIETNPQKCDVATLRGSLILPYEQYAARLDELLRDPSALTCSTPHGDEFRLARPYNRRNE